MSRKPTHDYMPNFEDEKHDSSLERVSLNKISNSPFAISSHVIDMTKKFNEKNKNNEINDTWSIDWQSQYDKAYFVPENRWTSEVTYQPEHIENNLYKIILPADIYIKKIFDTLIDQDRPEFISRTLYPYISKNFEINSSDQHSEYFPITFYWVYRWLPRVSCSLTFYTDRGIQDELMIKTNKTVINIDDDQHNVEIPFMVRKDIFDKMAFIKHDSAIMYMEINEE